MSLFSGFATIGHDSDEDIEDEPRYDTGHRRTGSGLSHHRVNQAARPSYQATPAYPLRKFSPNPSSPPSTLFHPEASRLHEPRYVYTHDQRLMLIYSGGSCLDNGTSQARAGCAFIYRPLRTGANPIFRLENTGPDGAYAKQSNNRAELRAAIAALDYKRWDREGFSGVVIASNSEYLTAGITHFIRRWRQNGWINARGNPVCNQDLWTRLVDVVEWWEEHGVQPQFWRIPREWMTQVAVRERARDAAALPEVYEWRDISP